MNLAVDFLDIFPFLEVFKNVHPERGPNNHGCLGEEYRKEERNGIKGKREHGGGLAGKIKVYVSIKYNQENTKLRRVCLVRKFYNLGGEGGREEE